MSEYDYWINVTRLDPPIGRISRHRAFVEYMYEKSGTTRTRVEHDFGETYGRTEDEARRKTEENIES